MSKYTREVTKYVLKYNDGDPIKCDFNSYQEAEVYTIKNGYQNTNISSYKEYKLIVDVLEIVNLEAEISRLREDNRNLIEEIKYIQSYSHFIDIQE